VCGQESPNEARRVSGEVLERFARSILAAAGAPDPISAVVAGSLVESNLVGHDSHGVRRLGPYLEMIERGTVRPAAEAAVLERSGATGIVTGTAGSASRPPGSPRRLPPGWRRGTARPRWRSASATTSAASASTPDGWPSGE
jgi:hypothetical protein